MVDDWTYMQASAGIAALRLRGYGTAAVRCSGYEHACYAVEMREYANTGKARWRKVLKTKSPRQAEREFHKLASDMLKRYGLKSWGIK